MPNDVILIGPIGTGKSTQGGLLSGKLGLLRAPMDDLRFAYYEEIGYSQEKQNEIGEKEGFLGIYRYWKSFEIHAVERLLSEHRDCVIDFGAGHSVYEEDALLERAKAALAPYPNVVLLLPSPDLDESVRLLKERTQGVVDNGFDFDEHFTKHRSNHELAKIVVYTKDRTPEETRDEILQRIKR
jgi:shikimate kinase